MQKINWGTVSVHRALIKNDVVEISVRSMSKKRTEIIVIINPQVPEAEYLEISTGTSGLSALLEVKRVMPSIVGWIKSIGRVPVADPADIRRSRAFSRFMEKFGIEQY